MGDTSASINLLDFLGDLVYQAKGIFERLLTQTLWDAHPASFYHSAVQEIIAFVEYAVTRALGISQSAQEINVVYLKWQDSYVDLTIGKEPTGQAHNYLLIEPLKAGLRIGVKASNASQLDERFKQCIAKILEGLLIDFEKVIKSFEQYEKSLFGQSLKEVVGGAAGAARDIYRLTASADAHVQIMLYHPGPREEAGESEKEGKNSNESGFLFYPAYDVEKFGYKINEWQEGRIFEHEYIEFKPKSSESKEVPPIHIRKPTSVIETIIAKILQWVKSDEISELDEMIYKNSDLKMRLQLLLGINEIRNDNGEEFKKACRTVLTRPENFLVKDLLDKPLGGNNSERPLCLQPKGYGVAGQVAESYVTTLVPKIAQEKSLRLEQRKDCLPYVLMGMFEAPFGLGPAYSGIVAPLCGKGQLLGVLVAYKNENGIGFTQRDVEIFESVASKVGKMIQETKDYMFFDRLLKVWSGEIGGKPGNFEFFVGCFTKILAFIMNTTSRSAFLVEMPPSEMKLTQHHLHQIWNPEGVSVEQIWVKPTNFGQPHFLQGWVSRKDSRFYVGEEVWLYIPGPEKQRESGEDKHSIPGSYCIIRIKVQEREPIFMAHKDELEVFFNYCFAITGVVRQARERDKGEEKTEGIKPVEARRS